MINYSSSKILLVVHIHSLLTLSSTKSIRAGNIHCREASLHIRASHVTSGAELRARFSRASMMAVILLIVELGSEWAAWLSISSRISVLIMDSVLPD